MTGDRGFGRRQHPEELLSASLSGDLTAAERSALDAHLAGCDRCRATLEAFAEERRLIAGLHGVTPPRDLAARVRAGIEGRRPGTTPWWRRPGPLVGGFAALTTVAAALLAIVVFSNFDRGPVASDPSASPTHIASEEITPTASQLPSEEPTPEPSAAPPVALEPGELGYMAAIGGGLEELRLSFTNYETEEVIDLGVASGPPIAAAVSPTGEFLAYITEVGETGAYRVEVARLSDGDTVVLGCGAALQFTDRLAWSDDGRFLAFTLASIDLGGTIDCGSTGTTGTGIDVWVYDAVGTGQTFQATRAGNAFAADFLQDATPQGEYKLLVSYAAAQPYSEPVLLPSGESVETERVNAFLPLVSPDGTRALFWRGVMVQNEGRGWRMEQGGMPYVTGEPAGGQPSWSGEQLFADLSIVRGEGFQAGHFTWGPDSDRVAFWAGEWTGTPQSADGRYPSSDDVYAGSVSSGLLTQDSAVSIRLGLDERVIGVAFDLRAGQAVVTAAVPRAGIGDGPSSYLVLVPLAGGEPQVLGGAANPQPWYGPAVIGIEAVAVAP